MRNNLAIRRYGYVGNVREPPPWKHGSTESSAMPPDVRRGSAPPVSQEPLGLCPWFGLRPRVMLCNSIEETFSNPDSTILRQPNSRCSKPHHCWGEARTRGTAQLFK